jgi:hypothetical protein
MQDQTVAVKQALVTHTTTPLLPCRISSKHVSLCVDVLTGGDRSHSQEQTDAGELGHLEDLRRERIGQPSRRVLHATVHRKHVGLPGAALAAEVPGPGRGDHSCSAACCLALMVRWRSSS